MERPSVRQLEYLVAAADRGHFGRAARDCAVTQPALSAQIQALEEKLGLRLFERSRRGVAVTRPGAPLVERARAALRALDDLGAAARELQEPLTGPLHLGVIPTVAPYLLPRWLPVVRDAFPKLRVFLHEDQTERIVERLRRGSLDLLLLALPVAGDDLEELPLFEEPFVLAAPAGHRLVRRRRGHVSQRELAREEVLLLDDGHCLRDQALEVCKLAGAREAEGVRASSLNTLVQMVASGFGVTLLPATAVEAELRGSDEIATVGFAAPAPSRTIGLVWRRASARGSEFEELAAVLRPHLPR